MICQLCVTLRLARPKARSLIGLRHLPYLQTGRNMPAPRKNPWQLSNRRAFGCRCAACWDAQVILASSPENLRQSGWKPHGDDTVNQLPTDNALPRSHGYPNRLAFWRMRRSGSGRLGARFFESLHKAACTFTDRFLRMDCFSGRNCFLKRDCLSGMERFLQTNHFLRSHRSLPRSRLKRKNRFLERDRYCREAFAGRIIGVGHFSDGQPVRPFGPTPSAEQASRIEP